MLLVLRLALALRSNEDYTLDTFEWILKTNYSNFDNRSHLGLDQRFRFC